MSKATATLLALATLSATGTLVAQNAYLAGPGTTSSTSALAGYAAPAAESYTQPAAPIERNVSNAGDPNAQPAPYPDQNGPNTPTGQQLRHATESQPAQGIWLRAAPDSTVDTVGAGNGHVELRVEHGRANVTVHHPAEGSEILVDLPGGQTSLLKDGFYTFNAETNTVRVLEGEAEVSSSDKGKAVKVKEDHELQLGTDTKAHEADRNELRADVVAGEARGGYEGDRGYGYGGAGYGGYGYGPYGDGFAYVGYPYGYGYGFGYPYYAFGYPGFGYGYGFGLGFGYYGGFGGFRGGYGGFRGGYGGFRGGFGGRR